jgi:hypothetical protein
MIDDFVLFIFHDTDMVLLIVGGDSLSDFSYGEGKYKSKFVNLCICEGELLLSAKTADVMLAFSILFIDMWVGKNSKQVLNYSGIYETTKKNLEASKRAHRTFPSPPCQIL